ncbi:four helix bundle protein [Synechococcus sp. Nb3U1]|uniref:four helix bundle protein n=1 Tax=Synechococcus sp. Nb3U1 TaxID=1914529 RepID=UPI001F2F7EDE|nr:four helix bundle protein [Synechococcus sp. Nb3U1]MCF2971833.1 four helix bundle protein [Synechococcus sp. Nb3U1]
MIYRYASQLPKEETYGMRSQLTRAAVSIPANIAEGQARHSTGEFLQFLGIARGSLAELETLLILCGNLNLLPQENVNDALSACDEIGKLLTGLVKSLRR